MSHLNPISKWEEQIEIQGLTLFDIHRKPRKVNRDTDAIIKIPLKVHNAICYHLFSIRAKMYPYFVSYSTTSQLFNFVSDTMLGFEFRVSMPDMPWIYEED